jgi:hypothetical protein
MDLIPENVLDFEHFENKQNLEIKVINLLKTDFEKRTKLVVESFDEEKIVHRLKIEIVSFEKEMLAIEEVDFEKRVKLEIE